MAIRSDWSSSTLLLALALASGPAAAEMPSVRLSSAPLVTPEDALTYYNSFPSPTQHTPGGSAWKTPAQELVVLARGLGGDEVVAGRLSADRYAERVAEYVRNNIDVEFRYGLGKGARGAVIDQSGTPFDQAHLMVELLRIAKVTASYKVGTITLNAQQFGQWTGLVTDLVQATLPALPTFNVNAQAACQFLADGGIPARVNSAASCSAVSGNLTTVTLGHIAVEVGGKLYDPAFKRYNLRSGIDLASAMGCGNASAPTCGNLVTTAAMTGAVSGTLAGAATISKINETALNTQAQSLTVNLQTFAAANNLADVDLEDVIGGRLPDSGYVPPAASSTLPYPGSVQLTWSGDIPDQYRTRVRFHYREIDPLLFADELAGRRIYFFSQTPLPGAEDNPLTLIIDGAGFSASRLIDSFVPVRREFETVVNHPYAANGGSYADETRNWEFGGRQLVGNQVLIFSLGNSGAGLPRHFSDYQNAVEAPPAGTFEPASGLPIVTQDAANFISAARLLYQESLGVRMLEGVSKTRITQHHAIGMTYNNSGTIPGTIVLPIDTGGTSFFSLETKLSVASSRNEAAARAATFQSLAAASAAIEGSVMQQAQDSWIPVTTGSIFSLANRKNIPFVNTSATNLGAVAPQLTNHNTAALQAAAAEGYEFILPQNGDPGSFQITGGFYFTVATPVVSSRADSIAYLIGSDIKGGGGQPGVEDPVKAVQKTVKPSETGLRQRNAVSVDLASGDFTLTAPPDIVTGAGEFPYSLPFQRRYVSSNSFADAHPAALAFNSYYGSDSRSFTRLGGGWTHNYQITATIGNDGDVGLGSKRGLDAVAAIAGVYSLYDLARTSTFQRRLTAPFLTQWVTQQFINNTASISRQLNVTTFVRLPDNTFLAPRGSAERLVQTGSRKGPLCAADCTQVSNGIPIYEAGTTYDYAGVTLAYTDADGSAISFVPSEYSKLPRIQNRIALPTFMADTWVFPNGIRLKFESTMASDDRFPASKRFLTGVSNNLGRSLTFVLKGSSRFGDADAPFAGQFDVLLNEVRDESGRVVKFERRCLPEKGFVDVNDPAFGYGPFACNTFEVVTPDGARTVYSYEIAAQSPQQNLLPRPSYRLRRWFTPDDPGTAFLTIDYDELYRVRRLLDKNLVATEYRMTGLFDEQQRRGEARDALGAISTQYFNDDNRLLASMDPLNRATYNTYDAAGRLVSTTFPELNKTTYRYDARSNLLSTTQIAKPGSGLPDIVTGATYPAACTSAATCNKPITMTDERGQVTTLSYNANTGQLLSVSEPSVPLGSGTGTPLTTYCYTSVAASGGTSLSLLTGQIERVNGATNRVTTFSYDPANKLVVSSGTLDPTNSLTSACAPVTKSGALNLTARLSFDAVGNVKTIDGPRTDVEDVTTYAFDTMRRVTRVTAPLGSITRFEYLADGLLSRTLRARVLNPQDGDPSHWSTEVRSYQPTGELSSVTDPEGNVRRFTYDALSRQILATDPDGRSSGTVYDLAGQVSCEWRGITNGTAPTSCTWNPAAYATAGVRAPLRYGAYTYTANGQRSSVQDANNNTTKYAYDGFDRLAFTLFGDPNDGSVCTLPNVITGTTTATCGTGQKYEQSTYDPAGNRLSLRTRLGDVIVFTYDNLDRVRTRAAPGLPTVTYDYNLVGDTSSVTSPAANSIAAHAVQYDYDAAGRSLFEQNLVGGAQARVSYQYDAAGNRTRTTWPDGYFVSYQYDALNRMTTAWEGAVNGTKLADYSYDVLSRRKQLQFAGQAGNRATYDYELDDDLSVLTNVLNTVSVPFKYIYSRSRQMVNINANDDFFLPSPPLGATELVADRLNRYASVAGEPVANSANGNLLSWAAPGGRQTYTYDSENRLRTAAVSGSTTPTIFYDYDPLGRRLSKTVDGVTTFYLLDGAEEIAELAGDMRLLRRYITGPSIDDRIATAEGAAITNPTKTYYHVNHQGSVIAMTDSAGNATGCATGTNCQRMSYDEYGQLGAGSVATGQPYRFTGRRFDPETGLYYYRARHYSPQLGRFLQTDPIGYEYDLNLYAYVGNDPVNANDPSGNCPNCVAAAGGAIIGGLAGGITAFVKSGGDLKKTLIGAGIGAGFGALAGFTFGASTTLSGTAIVGKSAAIGFAGGAGGNAVGQFLGNKGQVNVSESLVFGAFSTVPGGIQGALRVDALRSGLQASTANTVGSLSLAARYNLATTPVAVGVKGLVPEVNLDLSALYEQYEDAVEFVENSVDDLQSSAKDLLDSL